MRARDKARRPRRTPTGTLTPRRWLCALRGRMRVARHWRWVGLVAGTVVAVPLVAAASTPVWAPTIAAAMCPSCYGMQPIGESLFVDAAMPEDRRRALQTTIAAAEAKVAAFFGPLTHRRIILACGEEGCEDRLRGWLEGSARVRGFTYNAGWLGIVRLSPRGQSEIIVAHELSHVQVHAIIGAINQMRGIFPAWFDEGLAVVISEDRRYFKPGRTAAERCLPTPDGKLPVT